MNITKYKLIGITTIVKKSSGEIFYKYNFAFSDDRTNGLNIYDAWTREMFAMQVGKFYDLRYDRNGRLSSFDEFAE